MNNDYFRNIVGHKRGKSPLFKCFYCFSALVIMVTYPSVVWGLSELRLEPMCINYNGVVTTRNNVIIYGNFGRYLISNDNCRTWERFTLGNFDEIMFIENFNDTLWGVLKNGYVIVSADEGYSWERTRVEIDTDDILVQIIPTVDRIYLRGRYAVYSFDRNLRPIKRIRESLDTLLTITKFDYFDPTWPYRYEKYIYEPDYYVFDKYIINSTKKVQGPYSGFVTIDKDLNNWEIINPCRQIPEYLSDTNRCNLRKILFYKDEAIFYILSFSLFKAESNFSGWKCFFKDSLFCNLEKDTTSRNIVNDIINISTIYSNNNYLFGIKDTKIFRNRKYLWDGFYLKKFVETPRDTFVAMGTFYKDVLNIDAYDRISGVSSLGSGGIIPTLLSTNGKLVAVFRDSIHIFVNNHNFIFLTTNNGKDWKLVSFLAGKPVSILNDSTYFFSAAENSDMVIKTKDGGQTYSPSKRHFVDDTLVKDLAIKSPFLFYIDSTGQGFLTGCPRDFDTRWATSFTDDFWDTYDTTQTGIIFFTSNPKEVLTSNVCKIGSKYLVARNDLTRRWFKFFTCSIYIGDHNERKFKSLKPRFDSLYAILHIVPDNLGSFLAFCLTNDPDINYKDYFEIRYTNDTGLTWSTLHKLEFLGEVNQIYEHNRDSVFITFKQPDQLYLYDRTRDTLQLLWATEADESRNPLLMVISDRFYLVGRELFLENTDRSDLTQWREGKWDYGKPNFESVIFKGNVAIAGLSDSLRPFNYYKITLKKDTATSVEDAQLDVRYYTTHFYATEPYPLPARSVVQSKIYTDGSFDLWEAIDGVYDAMGNKLEGKERIRLKELGKATTELTWECSGVPSGIYFIVIRHNGRSDTIPVIME